MIYQGRGLRGEGDMEREGGVREEGECRDSRGGRMNLGDENEMDRFTISGSTISMFRGLISFSCSTSCKAEVVYKV